MILLAVAVLVASACLWAALAARRIERDTTARLRTGVDGIVPGAAPIALSMPGGHRAVLLLHGFGDTPQALTSLAHDLHQRGYAVAAPLLAGHGRTLRAFGTSNAAQWLADARAALAGLRARYEHVGVVGLSMGGALATLLAADDDQLPALVLLAPYLEARPVVRALARVHHVVGIIAPYISSGVGAQSIHDPVARAKALAYGAATPQLIAELVALADRARRALPRVAAPTLLVQSREDNRLTSASAERAVAALGASVKRLEWVSGCGHVLTVDYGHAHVSALVVEWLARHLERRASIYSSEPERQPSGD